MKKILVTGTAGLIGFHVAGRLIKDGFDVIGLSSMVQEVLPDRLKCFNFG